jgi:hypothetical protein
LFVSCSDLSTEPRVGMYPAAERNRPGAEHAPRPDSTAGIRSRPGQSPPPRVSGAPAIPSTDGDRETGYPRSCHCRRECVRCPAGVPGPSPATAWSSDGLIGRRVAVLTSFAARHPLIRGQHVCLSICWRAAVEVEVRAFT